MTNCIATIQTKRCRKRAKYFGKFAGGGLCLKHAIDHAKEFGFCDFHEESRKELESQRDCNGTFLSESAVS